MHQLVLTFELDESKASILIYNFQNDHLLFFVQDNSHIKGEYSVPRNNNIEASSSLPSPAQTPIPFTKHNLHHLSQHKANPTYSFTNLSKPTQSTYLFPLLHFEKSLYISI